MNEMKVGEAIVLYYNYEKRESVFALHTGGYVIHCYDLTICVEGKMEYLHNGKPITLGSGDAIMIRQGDTIERFQTDIPTKYASINVRFDYDPGIQLSGYLPDCVNPEILYLLECFKRDFNNYTPHRRHRCLSLFSYICNNIHDTVYDKENPRVREIKQYILRNLSGDLSLETIAGEVHITPQYMCTLFKKHTGVTVVNFILKERIDLAKRLIASLYEPISKIALQCGFEDYYYFSHTFKKLTGVSASNYRKSIRNRKI